MKTGNMTTTEDLEDILNQARLNVLTSKVEEALETADYAKVLGLLKDGVREVPSAYRTNAALGAAQDMIVQGDYENAIEIYINDTKNGPELEKRFGMLIAGLRHDKKYEEIVRVTTILKKNGYKKVARIMT